VAERNERHDGGPRPSPTRRPQGGWAGDRGGHVWAKDREVVTDDGARIRYTVRGHAEGPPIVLCSGFICPDNFWAHVGARLMQRHRVVVLNYRGVGASTEPRWKGYRAWRLSAADFTMERLAGDVAAVLDAEGMTDAVAFGHSMGVEVALALWRTRPELVAGLVLIAGPFASPLRTFYGTDVASTFFPLVRYGIPLLPRPVQKTAVNALRLPITMPVARLIRALGPHTPDADMLEYRHHFGRVDPMVALLTAEGMHRFDAEPWLLEVDVPVQVLIGTADTWAPPATGHAMLDLLPDAELWEIDEGTHGMLIEFPDEVHDLVADFLHRRFGSPVAGTAPATYPRVRGPIAASEVAAGAR
jgi:pimeloyl-ACP methyl ester carboxylesterase